MAGANRYNGGSIVSFIIITVAVAALLIGGVIWLRHRGEVAREQQAMEIAQQEESETSPEDQAVPDEDENSEEGGATESPADDTANETPATESEDEDGTGAAPTYLPESGPTEMIVSLAAIAILTYTATRYTLSRRERARISISS